MLLIGFSAGQADTIAATGRLEWTLDPGHMAWLLLGFVAYAYTYLHIQKMFWRLLAEIQSGTLEQTYLSPLPSWIHVVAGRIVAAIAESAFVVAVMYAVAALLVPIDLHWRLDALLHLALLIVGSAGIAMVIAGLTLVWKRIPLLNDLALMLVMFLSGAILPLTAMPGWAETAAKPLFLTHSRPACAPSCWTTEPFPSVAPAASPRCSPPRPPGSSPDWSCSAWASGSHCAAAASPTTDPAAPRTCEASGTLVGCRLSIASSCWQSLVGRR